MGTDIKYWKSLEELNNTNTPLQNTGEFSEQLPADIFEDTTNATDKTSRRDFLKYLGFSLTAASLASCEAPVVKSIPFINKPEEITPGVANWYASTYFDGSDYASILVKTREGRPIHIKGNSQYGLNKGAINARINASVLSLYDSERLQQPTTQNTPLTWAELDEKVMSELKEVQKSGKKIVILTPTMASTSGQNIIDAFKKQYNAEHISYDAVHFSAIAKANEESFGVAGIPTYDFSKAKTIVSFSADFLNDFLLSTVYTQQYAQNRNPENNFMSQHFHFESCLSLTGSNADHRAPLTPTEEFLSIVALHNEIATRLGKMRFIPMNTKAVLANPVLKKAVDALIENTGQSLVISGHNHVGLQIVINKINTLLNNIGTTVLPQVPVHIQKADETGILKLQQDMQANKIGALISWNVNPAYNLPQAESFKASLTKVPLTIALSIYQDETASISKYTAPIPHYLESWNDFQVTEGHFALAQPVISPLYHTRPAEESLLKWMDQEQAYDAYIKKNWETKIFPLQNKYKEFVEFWNYSLHNGVCEITKNTAAAPSFNEKSLEKVEDITSLVNQPMGEYQLIVYTKLGIGDGKHANNPWLQELPDPVSKVTWDNYITMNPADMKAFDFPTYYDQETPLKMANLSIDGYSLELPVFPSYGQKRKTVGIALGYGRGENGEKIGKAAFQTKEYGGYEMTDDQKRKAIGKNAYPFITLQQGQWMRFHPNVAIQSTEKSYKIACTQIHHTIMDRDSILKEVDFQTYQNSPKEAYNPAHNLQVWDKNTSKFADKNINEVDLWAAHPIEDTGHRWGMTIDLTTCIGCGTCATACQSENNVPVVGRDEIRRVRDMFWLRIDRYYSSDYNHKIAKEEGKTGLFGTIEKYHKMEVPSQEETLRVVFQPVMCQHCSHAPCETVCPVSATTHSNEGLNQMTYNRCVGTRYCANNCPYKVRRFNWFNYTGYKKFTEINPSQNVIGRMVLNPDVTVRTRGVMEKCSLCVQRIQEGKLIAKKAGKVIQDGAIQSACAAACPTQAITFGDLNDKKSNNGKGSLVRQKAYSDRAYRMLEEVGTQPGVYYLTKVRA